MQHDDHIWLTVHGSGWAIRCIERGEVLTFHLWRGYEPELEFSSIAFVTTDWPAYCDAAVAALEDQWLTS